MGTLFKVYNKLGYGYQEKYYHRAIGRELDKLNISFVGEQSALIRYEDKIIGRYFVDFIIAKKIVLEIKVAREIYQKHLNQVLGYLKATGLKLGILAVFTRSGVRYRRLVN
jgi:GxxExxY protein